MKVNIRRLVLIVNIQIGKFVKSEKKGKGHGLGYFLNHLLIK